MLSYYLLCNPISDLIRTEGLLTLDPLNTNELCLYRHAPPHTTPEELPDLFTGAPRTPLAHLKAHTDPIAFCALQGAKNCCCQKSLGVVLGAA